MSKTKLQFTGKAHNGLFIFVKASKRNVRLYEAFCLANVGKRVRCTYEVLLRKGKKS